MSRFTRTDGGNGSRRAGAWPVDVAIMSATVFSPEHCVVLRCRKRATYASTCPRRRSAT